VPAPDLLAPQTEELLPIRRTASSVATLEAPAITRDRVEEIAYTLWLQRGGEALTNWLDAERLALAEERDRRG